MGDTVAEKLNHDRIAPGTPVLITGATGFTGSVLARKLCRMGLDVRAIARGSSNLKPLEDLNIRWFRGNVFDPAVVAAACDGVSHIFHVAAAYREAKYDDEMYYKVHVESTRLLAKRALESAVFKRFVHISTIGVHGHIPTPPADETYRFAPGDVYQRTKADAELWIREFSKASGLAISVIRPAAIYGPGDRRLVKIFKMATWPLFPILGKGKCLYHLIHVDDLTQGIIRAAVHPAALGEVFICGNPDPITLPRMAQIVAKAVGRRSPRVVRLPVGPFFFLGAICEAIYKPFGVEPPIYRRRVAFYTKDRAFDTSKIREKLGFSCRYTNETGIEETAKWYLENGWIKA